MIHSLRHSSTFSLYSFPLFTVLLFFFFSFQEEKSLLKRIMPSLRTSSTLGQARQSQGTFQQEMNSSLTGQSHGLQLTMDVEGDRSPFMFLPNFQFIPTYLRSCQFPKHHSDQKFPKQISCPGQVSIVNSISI